MAGKGPTQEKFVDEVTIEPGGINRAELLRPMANLQGHHTRSCGESRTWRTLPRQMMSRMSCSGSE